MEVGGQTAGQDPAEGTGRPQECWKQHEKRLGGQQVVETLLDGHPGHQVQHAGHGQHGDRLADDPPNLVQRCSPRHDQHRQRCGKHAQSDSIGKSGPVGQHGGHHEGGHGGQVTQRGHQRRHHVVEVPPEADRTGSQPDGDHSDRYRGQQPPEGRDDHEIGQCHGGCDAEYHSCAPGQNPERRAEHQRKGRRTQHVLAHHAVGPGRQSEGPSVHRGAQPAAHGAEDVAPQSDGARDE